MSDTTSVASQPQQPFALEAQGLARTFDLGEVKVKALDGVDLTVRAGEFVAVMGPSGGGKSTLLALLGGLDEPTSGRVWVGGTDLFALPESGRVGLRRGTLGYVFQSYDLLPALTVLENVEFPLLVAGLGPSERRDKALTAVAEVGLAGKEHFLPDELSGGQQQRVGIARCLVTRPKVILADEPTGNLDTATTQTVLGLLRSVCKFHHTAVVVVTHDLEVAAQADRVIRIRDGRLEAA